MFVSKKRKPKKQKIRRIKALPAKKSPAETPKMLFDEWFSLWLNDYKKHRVKIGTLETYKQYYKSGQVSLECDFFHGMQISEKSYDENGNKFDAPKGSPEDKKWSKATSQSHRNAVLKEILKAREIGDKNGAMKIAEEFHTKSREKGTIAQMTALKFGKDK